MKHNYLRYPTIIFLCALIFIQPIFAGLPPEIIGESAILMDRKTGSILYKKNAFIEMYPASTTKILTSVLCIENMDLSAPMEKTNDCIQNVPSDSSHIGLRVGDTFSVLDGIYAVMLGSDNYVAHELGTFLDGSIENFAIRMNNKATQIGALDSHFVNPHGYHHPDHYTTAYDLALITDYAFKNDTFRNIAKQTDHILERQNNPLNPISFSHTVQLLQPESPFYSPYTIGGKTGFNTPAGRSLVAVAEKNGMELVGVVLKSTSPEFFEDMNTLFDYGFKNFALEIKDNDALLINQSFSPWAKTTVEFGLDSQLIDPGVQDYQTPISKGDFVELLMRMVHIAENKDLVGFSSQMAIDQALDWGLIKSTSILSDYNDPLDRETAASLTTNLLSCLNYKPITVYPKQQYLDHALISSPMISGIYNLQQAGILGSHEGGSFKPKDQLTWEQGLSIITRLYKWYDNSPWSFLNQRALRGGLTPNYSDIENIKMRSPYIQRSRLCAFCKSGRANIGGSHFGPFKPTKICLHSTRSCLQCYYNIFAQVEFFHWRY